MLRLCPARAPDRDCRGRGAKHNAAASRRLFLLYCFLFKPAEQQRKNPLRHVEVVHACTNTHTHARAQEDLRLGVKLKTVETTKLKRL